ncbi:exodeoxyribonuclease VII large subunit [Thermodesulfovibrio sp.]|uniref:exodeoxyribonuclease VII large subunit n=1 Tax=Thermodesulfovibrio sp. TaxID=2067987 RepID=UPI0030B7267E
MFNVEVTYQSLSDYLTDIRDLIQENSDYQWIVAEIAKVNVDKTGHYWLELVEKKDSEVIAQCKAVIWKGNSETVQAFFLKTGTHLQPGMKILFLGRANFHEKHGFNLKILQIDPSFTLGEMALKKKEILDRLTREGLIDKNKLLEIPVVIQRIAIVSSKTAAGYEDFLKILKGNAYGFIFHTFLFDAYVQGEEAANSMIKALKRCAREHEKFDAVVLIRGGGSVVDLHCFNDYELAKKIALMPIPVLTGIGHTRDETVADYVASISFKTPSELAKFIIDRAFDYYSRIENIRKALLNKIDAVLKFESARVTADKDRLISIAQNTLERSISKINLIMKGLHTGVLRTVNSERENIFSLKQELHRKTNMRVRGAETSLNNINNRLKIRGVDYFTRTKFQIKSITDKLRNKTESLIKLEKIHLERLSEKVYLLSPENVLKRGYSIAYFNGKVLKDVKEVRTGQNIQIKLYRGKITGKVINKEEENDGAKLF